MMALGMDGVFVGSGIFACPDPPAMAAAIVQAVTHWRDAKKLAQISTGLPQAMKGIEVRISNDTINAHVAYHQMPCHVMSCHVINVLACM
jgi:pyridoxal 5'-phosphate synthase pdxS subunit